jgi:ketosteroid isomerase-like protein
MLVRWAPVCQLELLPELVAAGMRSSYHGHAGLRQLMADWADAWERIDLTPQWVVDTGDAAIGLGHSACAAGRAGVELESPIAFVWWSERGLVVRQRDFSDWDEALRAAGIPTAAAR